MATVDLGLLPSTLQKRHKNQYSAGLIARLAVDKRYAKQGFGVWLLVDALKKLLVASDTVAFPIIIVDAKEGMLAFYEKFGFTAFGHEDNKLFISVSEVRASFT